MEIEDFDETEHLEHSKRIDLGTLKFSLDLVYVRNYAETIAGAIKIRE